MKNSVAILVLAASLGVTAADVPWKFEGSTNRVAAATCESSVPCGDFQACAVTESVAAQSWEELMISIWTTALSSPASMPGFLGMSLYIR